MLLNELVIVPGHATFSPLVRKSQKRIDILNEDNWTLLAYQKGEVKFYLQHIHRGLDILRNNPRAILVFAGGYTRQESQEWSEASTYWRTAKQMNLMETGDFETLAHRIYLEERSTDSLQNLACSLDLFRSITSKPPVMIKVVGWKFKKCRYLVHAQSISWPGDKFEYVGVNDPDNLREALEGEKRTIAKYNSYFDEFEPDKPDYRIWKLTGEMRNLFSKVISYNQLEQR